MIKEEIKKRANGNTDTIKIIRRVWEEIGYICGTSAIHTAIQEMVNDGELVKQNNYYNFVGG